MDVSILESVIVAGFLRGQEIELPCTIRAIKVSIPKLDIWEYVAAEIADPSIDVPDGDYEIHFEGRKFRVWKVDGRWQSRDM